jgi:hypothetical protein
MSDTIRIRTEVGKDHYLKIPFKQEFNFLEILSLKISQEDVYKNFSADYGCVVGRVTLNNVGVPNCRVSIFIPLTDEDSTNDAITSLYPYKNIFSDKDKKGIRYNLLPEDSQSTCHTPVGTFPSKRRILDNDTLLEIHEKYYKYTAITNHAGDFMLMGVPVGNHILHMDCDISDIGLLSQKPYDLIRNGSNITQFESSTKFKSSVNLDSLPQVKTVNKGINVVPFWSDVDNTDMGITRVDITIPYNIQPSAIMMGSIFSDNEANSLSKQCRPRKKMGNLSETTTGEGLIQMIRETYDGQVEEFSVETIDSDGTYSYQIPMNLDYIVTDEFGNLIPSEDPTKGIPTRANVRLKLTMDITGGESMRRTRAAFLIPNNPTNGEGDYSFGVNTPIIQNETFKELHWNKLYTTKQFIPRFQRTPSAGYYFTAIKDVDESPGTHQPFPFNRVDTNKDFIFEFFCFFLSLTGYILSFINAVIILIVNSIISAINLLLSEKNELSYKKCMAFQCGDIWFAPGCGSGTKGLAEAEKENSGVSKNNSTTAYNDCQSVRLAENRNVFKFHFFNDWINGIIYLPLFKYKKEKKVTSGKVIIEEKLCDFDCDYFDSNSKNDCDNNYIADGCTSVLSSDSTKEIKIREGLIKRAKLDNGDYDLYYAAATHQGNVPLYPVNIISLGSIVNCDYQNVPIMYPELLTTTYKRPDFVTDNNTGVTGIDPLLMTIFCGPLGIGGVTVTDKQCQNNKRICELGVDLDERPHNDERIDNNDIDNHLIRKKFISINQGTSLVSTNDNFDGTEYKNFRNFAAYDEVNLPKGNSLYFYFGITPGKSALDKANSKYFAKCTVKKQNNFIIKGEVNAVTTINGSDGSIDITMIGGIAPFTYLWSNGATTQDISLLTAGNYTVVVKDSTGAMASRSFEVKQPLVLTFDSLATDATQNASNDGKIIITPRGGTAPYNAQIISGPSNTFIPTGNFSFTVQFTGLVPGNYIIEVTDSSSPTQSYQNTAYIVINEPAALVVPTPVIINNTCNGGNTGKITINPSGGVIPYYIKWRDSSNAIIDTINMTTENLVAGTYSVEVIDAVNQTVTYSNLVVTEPIVITFSETHIAHTGVNSDGSIQLTASGGVGLLTYSIYIGNVQQGVSNFTGTFTGLAAGTYTAKVVDDNNCEKIINTIII